MLSRENRVILGSFLLFAVVMAGAIALELRLGVAVSQQPLVAFLVLVGLPIVVPQLYLAATDDDVSPRTRVRFAAIAALVFALLIADGTVRLQDRLLLAIGAGSFLGLVAYEFVAGYRGSAAESAVGPDR